MNIKTTILLSHAVLTAGCAKEKSLVTETNPVEEGKILFKSIFEGVRGIFLNLPKQKIT